MGGVLVLFFLSVFIICCGERSSGRPAIRSKAAPFVRVRVLYAACNTTVTLNAPAVNTSGWLIRTAA
jgi:hypothetical protein